MVATATMLFIIVLKIEDFLMVLPLYPNTITLNAIRNEFKGPAGQARLSQYYASGVNVRAGTFGFPGGVKTPIPSSGRIALSNFFGAKKSAVIEEYEVYSSYYGSYMWVSQNPRSWFPWSSRPFTVVRSPEQSGGGGDGESGYPATYTTQAAATAQVAFRTPGVTQAQFNSLTNVGPVGPWNNLRYGFANPNIASYMSYAELKIINPGDLLYLTQAQSSDDVVVSAFFVWDFDTGTGTVVNAVGGDNNGRDSWGQRVRNHTHFGGNWNGNGISLENLSGRKVVFPAFYGYQTGSKINNNNFELQIIHCKRLFSELDLTAQTASVNGSGGYPLLSGGGANSCRPDLFEIANGVTTVKSDIIVFANFNQFSAGLSVQDYNRNMLAVPQNYNLATCGTMENYTGLIPVVVKAGSYSPSSWMGSLGTYLVGT